MGKGITDSPTGFAAAAAPAAATATATAAATAAVTPAPGPGPAPPSLTDVATAVAAVVVAAIALAPAPDVMVTTPPTPSVTRLRMLFNPNSLPNNVRTRYNHKQSRKILTTVIHAAIHCPGDPCSNLHHWIDPGLEKTTCGDGSFFFHVPIDEKLVMKNSAPCKNDSHAAVRRWCQTFQETMMQHGAYVHPIWLFARIMEANGVPTLVMEPMTMSLLH